MPLQIKRVAASDFTIAGSADLSLVGAEIVPDDYVVGSQTLFNNASWKSVCERSDGALRMSGYYKNKITKMPATLDSFSLTDLSDADNHTKHGMCLDDENYIYLSCYLNPGHVKKYADNGTLQWTYTGTGSTPGNVYYAGGVAFYNNLIFIADIHNSYIHIINKSGSFVAEINCGAGGSTLIRPRSVWVDSDGIWVCGEYGRMTRWNSSSYAFIENLNPVPLGFVGAQEDKIRRLTDGTFIIGHTRDYRYDSQCIYLIDSSQNVLAEIGHATRLPSTDSAIGGIHYGEQGYTPYCINETNKILFVANYVGFELANTVKIVKINMKDADERLASVQHDFGSPVTLERLSPIGKFDTRNTTYKQFRLWYQWDGGGYVEVDLQSTADIDTLGTVLDVRIGLTDWRFPRRNDAAFKGVDIVYDDGQKDIGERSFETIDMSEETEVIDLSSEVEVVEL